MMVCGELFFGCNFWVHHTLWESSIYSNFGYWLTGKVSDWNFNLHDLQLCFGVKDFLVCFDLHFVPQY